MNWYGHMCNVHYDWPAYLEWNTTIDRYSLDVYKLIYKNVPLYFSFRNSESHCYLSCHISSCWLINNHHIWLNHDDGTFFERKITEIEIGRKAHHVWQIFIKTCTNQQTRIAITNVFCLLWLIQYLITVKQINLLFLINHWNVCLLIMWEPFDWPKWIGINSC